MKVYTHLAEEQRYYLVSEVLENFRAVCLKSPNIAVQDQVPDCLADMPGHNRTLDLEQKKMFCPQPSSDSKFASPLAMIRSVRANSRRNSGLHAANSIPHHRNGCRSPPPSCPGRPLWHPHATRIDGRAAFNHYGDFFARQQFEKQPVKDQFASIVRQRNRISVACSAAVKNSATFPLNGAAKELSSATGIISAVRSPLMP